MSLRKPIDEGRLAAGIAMLSVFALASCDATYGISTYATLAAQPDIDCMDRTLTGLSLIHVVKSLRENREDTEIFPDPGRHAAEHIYWQYEVTNPAPALQQAVAVINLDENNHEISFSNGLQSMGQSVSKAEMDAFEPVLKAVNSALITTCALEPTAPLKIKRIT